MTKRGSAVRAEHWLKREFNKFLQATQDPFTWIMTGVILLAAGVMVWFLLNAANNFGTYFSMPYACSAHFTQARLFFLSMLAPLFFVAVFVFMGELSLVLGLRKKRRGKISYRFLAMSLVAMFVLGAISFTLLSC
jgi:hypothetical protein